MATVIRFQDHALANLRARLGAAEEAREDLIAFARGHSGAVAAIHEAVLAAIAAPDPQSLVRCVTQEWRAILAIDSVALALIVGDSGFLADMGATRPVAPALIDRAIDRAGRVRMASVERGDALFGARAPHIRAEALVPFDCGRGLPRGLLLLGQDQAHALHDRHGGELLLFLARSLGAMIARWLTAPTD